MYIAHILTMFKLTLINFQSDFSSYDLPFHPDSLSIYMCVLYIHNRDLFQYNCPQNQRMYMSTLPGSSCIDPV